MTINGEGKPSEGPKLVRELIDVKLIHRPLALPESIHIDDGVQIRTPSDLREFTQAAFYAAATAKAQEIERNQEPASD